VQRVPPLVGRWRIASVWHTRPLGWSHKESFS
jgi:hypothetical protein